MGAADNTLVVFSSDNGAVVHRELLEYGHDPNSVFIGQKTDIWEGGQRVPFIARWPERVPAGQTSADMVCLVDMLATSAALLGQDLPADAGPDSFNILPSILCEPGRKPPRETMVLGWPGWALRDSSWLYIPHQGSGGVTTQPGNPAGEGWVNLAEAGFENSDYDEQGKLKENAPPGQLYDLAEDPDQTVNLFRDYPNRVAMMDALLERIKDKGERLVTR
jgi:arylsulfatase A-like enzyme